MLTFWDWVGGPVVGSNYNDEILQNAGISSKYGAVVARPKGVMSKADCNFLGNNCEKDKEKDKHKKRRKNG